MAQKDLYNKAGYWTFLITLAFNIIFFLYISLVHPGTPENPGGSNPSAQTK
ncbi:hypothetical protein LPTSP4_23210 [Leptospira ryugenii]|uniref:Uncharacterized protein n=1 Tax=Leptospira ryugenii TaxID=1917863 RepID=A0A2P2E1Q7_9LEPT|nr:hypothetical protein [Leptospira ryugenii]GBF50794.1 hypothetical protein LPTSP4_23210 [Leptospira ryugenii]